MSSSKKWSIKKSPIAGEGVFAATDIPKGMLLGRAFTQKKKTGIPDKDYIRTRLGEKTNHAQKSNTELIQKGASWYLEAKRNIKKGEEITLNYVTIPWQGKRRFYSL